MNRHLRRALIVAGLGVYTLVLAEGCVRFLDPQPLMPRYITGTPWGIRGNIPHAVYHHRTPEVTVEYRINGQGMRLDREVPFAKPAGSCRLALFGDSFFVGYELNLADTFATQLESMLRARGYTIEVLNFSVSGFGTAEMLRSYERDARRYDPDYVVFEWHSTDLDDNVRSDLFRLKDQRLIDGVSEYLPSVAAQDALMRSGIYRFVADHSQLYSWVRERAANAVKKALVQAGESRTGHSQDNMKVRGAVDNGAVLARDAYPENLSAALLAHAAQEIQADGRGFLVVDVPDAMDRTTFKSAWDTLPQSQIKDLVVVRGKQALDPLASLNDKLYYERGHGHLSPRGARALAMLTADTIATDQRITACRR